MKKILIVILFTICLFSCTNEGDITINANSNGTNSKDPPANPSPDNTNSNTGNETSNEYTPLECPNGYVSAKGNSDLGVNSFCVMKYEASISNGSAVSVESLAPAGGVSPTNAKNYCTSITDVNFNGSFDLISNPEWIALAREIENDGRNWSGGEVGNGCLFRGNSGVTDACSYDGANPEFGSNRNSKARHFLESNEEIWDLSANYWEMVDFTLGGSLEAAPSSCGTQDVWHALTDVPTLCPLFNTSDFTPSVTTYSTATGHGSYYGGYYNAPGGYIGRGGHYGHGVHAGLYTFNTYFLASDDWSPQGFRCVYRP